MRISQYQEGKKKGGGDGGQNRSNEDMKPPVKVTTYTKSKKSYSIQSHSCISVDSER